MKGWDLILFGFLVVVILFILFYSLYSLHYILFLFCFSSVLKIKGEGGGNVLGGVS